MLPAIVVFLMTLGFGLGSAFAQNAVEVPDNQSAPYPAEWPKGPGRDSVPAWAAPGKIRFSRWDGGRIETAKAFLSGWPGLNPPDPDILYTMTNWYDPKTIRFAKEAGLNLIWITLSVGFSNETEAAHRAEVQKYITECHRQGIHVMAYESIANLFWEDMFQVAPLSKLWIQLGTDGKPVPYGAATYAKMGRITRYMADLSNPAWRAYLKKRIDLAIDSGADGLIYDNNFGNTLFELYPQLVGHSIRRKKDFLLMANFHTVTYVLNRLLNCITTEDGVEPGLYSPSSKGYADLKPYYPYLYQLSGKSLINNIGLMRIHETLAEGWKPVMIEDGGREHAERMVGLMSPARSQLALAEAMMFGIAHELYVEARPAHQLMTGDRGALETWRAIGKYNQFFSEHQNLYAGARSRAPLAVILDDRSEGVPLLDGLAARRVLFEVIYERDVTAEALSRHKAVALLTARLVRPSALSALEAFVRNGGQLIAAGDAATLDEKGAARERPSFFGGQLGSGKAAYIKQLPAIDELAKLLLAASGDSPIRLEAPDGILYNVTEQPERKRTLVHLLNYTLEPVTNLQLKVSGSYRAARLVSPDAGGSFSNAPTFVPAAAGLQLPQLRIYSVIILDRT